MSRRLVRPTERPGDSVVADSVLTHPAFGVISATRVNSSGTYLNGSDFKHHTFVAIEIRTAEVQRGVKQDWTHGRETIARVALSEAQWAGFLTRMNMGDGVPCTIEQRESDHAVPGIAVPRGETELFGKELRKSLESLTEDVAKLRAALADVSMPKAKRQAIEHLLICLQNDLGPNVEYTAQCFGEHVETTKEKAKTEIEAYLVGTVQRAGLTALQDARPFSLPEPPTE